LPVCVAGGMTGSHTKMMREKLNRIGAMRKGARSGGQAPLLGLAPGGGTRESGAVPMASIERGIDHSAEDSYRQPASTCGAKSPLFGSVPPNHPPLFGSVPPNHPLLGRLRKRAKPSGKGKTPGDRPPLSWGFLAVTPAITNRPHGSSRSCLLNRFPVTAGCPSVPTWGRS
jgi:hypothetical protein